MERVVHDVMEDIISLGKDYFCFWLMHHGVIKMTILKILHYIQDHRTPLKSWKSIETREDG